MSSAAGSRASITDPADARRTRTVTFADPLPLAVARRSQDGLAFFRAIASGALPQPPIYGLLDFRIAAAERGAARFEGKTGEHLANADGFVDAGVAATLLDSACGVAVQTTLPVGSGTATIRLDLTFFAPIGYGAGISATSRIVHGGRRVAWSDAELRDGGGGLLARARGRFAVFATERAAAEAIPAPHFSRRTIAWPDPAPLLRAKTSGLETLRAMIGDGLPHPPICHTAGFRFTAAAAGKTALTCAPQPLHYNPLGGVHGGLAAILTGSCGMAAIESALSGAQRATLVNLSVDYLRPITTDAGELTAAAEVLRAGANIAIADAELAGADGKLYARAQLTAVVGSRQAAVA